ncbi:unnamed protein product [Lupinus luteus]|uniref:Uncharacterized protein n=1 Tax=Lupinus luteus TaxID=3873 RepID=A0AAV1X527_LUPLU
MQNSGVCVLKECHGKIGSLQSLGDDRELSDKDSSKSQFKNLIKRSNSDHAIVVNDIQSQISKVCFKDLFFERHVHGLDNRVPKHMVSVDEKYLRLYLEFMHNSALKAAQYNTPAILSATNAGILSESSIPTKSFGGSRQFAFECPGMTETGRVAISDDAGEQWTSGTVMGSKSMINILNSTLLQQFGVSDRNDNLNRMDFTDAKDLTCCDFVDSSSDLSFTSSYKETPLVLRHEYSPKFVHKRLASISTTNSTCSDWLPLPSPNLSRGMIQLMWENGVPHFVFSEDDKKEVYVSKLMKLDSTDDKSLDYVYQFYLDKHSRKGHEIPDSRQLVGKMNVSTSFTICPNNCRIMETQFTLFGNMGIYDKQMHKTIHSHKNKGLSKKMSNVFRTIPPFKHRTLSMFGGSCAISEIFPWESHALGATNFLDANVPPNFELAAIVMKERLPCKKQDKFGGWGLKFLNKSRVSQSTSPAESCSGNTPDCSTSTDIIIPAGLHGGPITRNGGPSSLIDRWKSGGHCDCGGWDEGCPLTVLQRKSSEEQVLSQVDTVHDCKTVDLVTQGSSDFNPTLRIENVHEGLCYIHFQRPLSALQSFAIAMAIIHAQSPSLQPNAAQELQ